MTNYLLSWFFGLLILAAIVIPILFATGVIKTGSNNTPDIKSKPPIDSPSAEIQPFITPTPFKTGYLSDSPQPLADLCNSTMYPVQPPYVDYGEWN